MRALVRFVALLLALLLASSVAMADAAPNKEATRSQVAKEWWLWTVVAVLSAGTVVTSVVVATLPGGSLNPSPTVGTGTMALTVRF